VEKPDEYFARKATKVGVIGETVIHIASPGVEMSTLFNQEVTKHQKFSL